MTAATWHNADDTAIRVSFLDLATNKYRHVLLVEPTSNSNFAAVTGHGHGMYWSGNKLVVATSGSVLRVFDLRAHLAHRHSPARSGLGADGKYHALWHAFALPQIGAYWYAGGGCANTDRQPSLASPASRSTTPTGSFVAAEHTDTRRRPDRPLAARRRRPVSRSQRCWRRPGCRRHSTLRSGGCRAAVSYNGVFVITGVCPEYADNIGDGVDYPSCLHRGTAGASTTVWTKAPKNTENLSYWPATNELWLLNEQLRERVAVHIPWP